MNVAHPFRESNGRSTRIWLDMVLKKEIGRVDKEDYMLAMERSPICSTEIRTLLKGGLTEKVDDKQVYMKDIDASYRYEGYITYSLADVIIK